MTTSLSLEKIKQGLQAQKPTLIAKYKIKEIGIFGSYVRGQEQAKSDLDILVDFDEYPSLLEFVGLEQALSDALGLEVDLVMKSGLKPRIGQQILQEVIYL